jgi:AAA domain
MTPSNVCFSNRPFRVKRYDPRWGRPMKSSDLNSILQIDGLDAARAVMDRAEVLPTGRSSPRRREPVGQSSKSKAAFPFSTFDETTVESVSKQWLFKGLLARGETTVWIGAPGTLKSALLTDIAVCLASNRNWCGRQCKGPASVLYFALERADLVRRRLAAYRTRDNLKGLPIAIVPKLVNLMDSATVDTVVATIDAVETRFGCPIGLLIFDTFPKAIAAGGGDEDKARDQGVMFANIQRIKERRAVHVVLAGHTGKDVTRGARGSNAALGDADLMVMITGAHNRTATIVKANDMPEGPIASFRGENVELGIDDDGDPVRVAIVAPVETTQASKSNLSDRLRPRTELAKRTLANLVCEGEQAPAYLQLPAGMRVVKREAWRERVYREGFCTESKPGARRTAWMRAVEDLKRVGVVSELDGWVWLTRPDEAGVQP